MPKNSPSMERNDLLTRFDRKYQSGSARNYEVDHTFVNSGSTEPVTSAEVKAYSLITSTAQDSVLSILIPAAREAIEKYTKLSLITREVTLQFNNPNGGYELPWGPVVGSIVLKDVDGNVITDPVIRGLEYKRIEYPCFMFMTAIYTAGFTTIPSDLKIAIMDQVDFMYEHRGSDVDTNGICKKAIAACQRWTRNPVIS